MTRGLLIGTDYAAGRNYRGVWGLYGSYDYIEPQIFRVSTTALLLGTTGQWWVSRTIALQGSVLAGAGYGAVGTVHGTAENDYNFGVAPQASIALRVIFGDRVALETSTRENFVSRLAGPGDPATTTSFARMRHLPCAFTSNMRLPSATCCRAAIRPLQILAI